MRCRTVRLQLQYAACTALRKRLAFAFCFRFSVQMLTQFMLYVVVLFEKGKQKIPRESSTLCMKWPYDRWMLLASVGDRLSRLLVTTWKP